MDGEWQEGGREEGWWGGTECHHTPTQELWALFDWTHQGQLLGTMKTFSETYESHICKVEYVFVSASLCLCFSECLSTPTSVIQTQTHTQSREKNASRTEQRLGGMMADSLQRLMRPFLLRRSKAQVMQLPSSPRCHCEHSLATSHHCSLSNQPPLQP